MKDITTIGLDTAKSVFQVHGVDMKGETVLRRQLKRRQFMHSLPSSRLALSGSKRAARHIIGHANSRR